MAQSRFVAFVKCQVIITFHQTVYNLYFGSWRKLIHLS